MPGPASKDCPKCWGCGKVANSEQQEPWSVWAKLPLESSVAVLTGIVRPIPCPKCGGTGSLLRE